MTTEREISLGNWNEMASELFPAHPQWWPMVARALHDAVQAEQDRCAKIAEYHWQKNDPLIESNKNTAYLISTSIRALRRPLRGTQEGRKA